MICMYVESICVVYVCMWQDVCGVCGMFMFVICVYVAKHMCGVCMW